jgi:hypothetical protein
MRPCIHCGQPTCPCGDPRPHPACKGRKHTDGLHTCDPRLLRAREVRVAEVEEEVAA